MSNRIWFLIAAIVLLALIGIDNAKQRHEISAVAQQGRLFK